MPKRRGRPPPDTADRFWVLGDLQTDDTAHRPCPRVYGPYYDYPTACASAHELNGLDTAMGYVVLAEGPDTPIEPRRTRRA